MLNYVFSSKAKSLAFFAAFLLLLVVSGSRPASAALPNLVGEAAVLMDAETGTILASRNPEQRLPMASTTKMMTALIALERGQLDETVTVSEEAAYQEGSSMYTSPGETYTLEEMLYGLLLNSGHDAAWAIAEHVAGSVPEFVELMNEKALELGATNTHFANPSGLPDPEHYSTARDLALIAQAALARSDFSRLVATKAQEVPWPVKGENKLLINHNRLLWRYDGADGVKTGYTNEARQCLVASATREERRLIAVILKSEGNSVWTDAEKLLDYGFANFENRTLVRAGESLASAPVKGGESEEVSLMTAADLTVTLPKGAGEEVEKTVEVLGELEAPVAAGHQAGELVFSLAGEEIGRVPLVTTVDVARPVKKNWWFWAAAGLALYTLVYLIMRWDIRRRRQRMRLRRIIARYRYRE
jgi:D-alanyl-D-alanine carboxypeptidase (penicillin-binding protein 5/6)